MAVYELKGKTPFFADGCWIAPSADIIGDVHIGESSTVWFNVTIRGDVMPIKIGKDSNIQDGSTLHGTYGKCGVVVGDRVTVGHNVILHGCSIGDECLIGMGSVIMDLATIPSGCVVGAGSLVTENASFPPGSLILGRPAKAVRALNEKEQSFLKQSADNYLEYASWYSSEKTGDNENE